MRAKLLGIKRGKAGRIAQGRMAERMFKAPSTRTKQVLSLLGFSAHIPVSQNNRLWISWGIPAGKTRCSGAGMLFKETKCFMSSPSCVLC